MTKPVGRLYATALALVLFFLTWAVVAAKPWTTADTPSDPRLQALALREKLLRQEAKSVNRVVARRWALYRRELAARRKQIAAVKAAAAAAPPPSAAVRVVTLPPITITRTS
jgi:hypothetical protein